VEESADELVRRGFVRGAMRQQRRHVFVGRPTEQRMAEMENDVLHASSGFVSPAVEPSRPWVSPVARRGSRSLHSALPSSTPHWSKLLICHNAPLTKTRCSYIAISAPRLVGVS